MSTNKQDWKRTLIFLAITFGLTWGYCLLVLYPIANGASLNGIPSIELQLLTAAVMFFPALAVLLTRLITGEGFRDSWLKPNFKKNIKVYLLAWFGPGVLTLMGGGLYFLLFPGSFDPELGYMMQLMKASGVSSADMPMPLDLLMLVQGVQALLLAPVLNFVTCFGEEWGWRGYLVPKMTKQLPSVPMLLVTGLIWGLWHAPLTIIGHNYGTGYPGFPFVGIAMMCLFCTVLGVFMSYVTLKTGSCIPAIIAHGAVNGISAMGIYFTADGGNPFIGPAPTGIIGMIPFLILAVFLAIRLKKDANA